ncbi:MAG: spore protease YyaC [Lachnospiraceae bacterium]|nr:spore protease YyaC [Lachnospiraceae bacterium]
MQNMQKEKKIFYFNTKDKYASFEFGDTLYRLLQKHYNSARPLIFLCIGSDRATGDCLGPLLGHKLHSSLYDSAFHVYGTLQEPVHARNLSETLDMIHHSHHNPFIIAVDASLGKSNHIGYYTVGEGALKPGAGVDKELPCVGDLCITGIVNMSGLLDHMLLQTTRLQIVMSLTDQIYAGINYCIRRQLRSHRAQIGSSVAFPLKQYEL